MIVNVIPNHKKPRFLNAGKIKIKWGKVTFRFMMKTAVRNKNKIYVIKLMFSIKFASRMRTILEDLNCSDVASESDSDECAAIIDCVEGDQELADRRYKYAIPFQDVVRGLKFLAPSCWYCSF